MVITNEAHEVNRGFQAKFLTYTNFASPSPTALYIAWQGLDTANCSALPQIFRECRTGTPPGYKGIPRWDLHLGATA